MSGSYYTNAHLGSVRRLVPDLIRHRQLLADLVWKDIRVRYRYALLGFLWAVLEPLALMVVLTIVFSYFFRARVEGLGIRTGPEYAVFILSGLVFWQLFAGSVRGATKSLTDNRALVTKVNFPREVVPLSYIGVELVNFLIGFVLLLILFVVLMGEVPGIGLVYMVPVLAIELALIAGLALIFSSLNAGFRDIGYMVDAALVFGFYASPVFYAPELVKSAAPGLHGLYFLNPLAGLLTAAREALFSDRAPSIALIAWPALAAILSLVMGVLVFRRNAPTLADRL